MVVCDHRVSAERQAAPRIDTAAVAIIFAHVVVRDLRIAADGRCALGKDTCTIRIRCKRIAADLTAVHGEGSAGRDVHAATLGTAIMGDLAVLGGLITASAVAEG